MKKPSLADLTHDDLVELGHCPGCKLPAKGMLIDHGKKCDWIEAQLRKVTDG